VQVQKISQHICELNHLYIWCDIILLQEPFTLGEQMPVPKNPIETPNTVHDLQKKDTSTSSQQTLPYAKNSYFHYRF
jgi:hypothetical protein